MPLAVFRYDIKVISSTADAIVLKRAGCEPTIHGARSTFTTPGAIDATSDAACAMPTSSISAAAPQVGSVQGSMSRWVPAKELLS